MFNRKKNVPPKQKEKRDLSQYGLFEVPDNLDLMGSGSDGGESDLEAELKAITGGTKNDRKPKPIKKVIPDADLDRMVAESLKDVDTDVDSEDENDPNLLSELSEIAGGHEVEEESSPTAEQKDSPAEAPVILSTTTLNVAELIKERIEMYTIAERNAKTAGDSSRARRFNRGLNTLKDLSKKVSKGLPINMDDIPPEVSTKSAKETETKEENSVPPVSPPVRKAPPPPSPITQNEAVPSPETVANVNPTLVALNERKNEYKVAALNAKKEGNTETALKYVKILKQFDFVIKAVGGGQEVDLNEMPPHPWELAAFEKSQEPQQVQQPVVPEPPKPEEAETQKATEVSGDIEIKSEELITATTIEEGLCQRLEKYKSVEQVAKDEGNTSKARRFGRIVKQYEDAIKLYKAGKIVPYDELPTPPGFGPLPTGGDAPKFAPVQPAPSSNEPAAASVPAKAPAVPPRPPLRKQESTRTTGNLMNTSIMEKQVAILLARQKEFKDAAINAKKSGEIDQAKEYLKIYKGFDKLIDTARGGFPVDMSTLPIPPGQRANLEDSFTFVNDADFSTDSDESDISARLEEQLQKQLTMCKTTRDHHRAMGDVVGTNRFENLALSVQKDLDIVRLAKRQNLPIPKFHYEQKNFSIVKCNTDLTDNEVEVSVVRGINYNVPNPKDVDTYVKIEFPYPQDEPTKARTQLVKNTDSPEYEHKNIVEIQRSNKQCQRLFKRQAIKMEVYSDRGFLRSDHLIGTVNVKLQPLETVCEIHDSFNLMDGRKIVGGKLEVKVRIRNPILIKQVEQINEKWVVIDV